MSIYARKDKAAHIQTSDGFFVDVDVSILYHIADPYKVFTIIGPGNLFEDNGIIPKTEPALKETLGELTTEQFYNSLLRSEKAEAAIVYRIDPAMAPLIIQRVARNNQELRDKIVRTISRSKPRDIFGELKTEEFYVASRREGQAQKAKEILQKMLKPMGIIVEKVLTKDYRFNPKYQQAIEDKKVADQKVEKNKSAQHAAIEEYKRMLEEVWGLRAFQVNDFSLNL